MIKDKMRQCVYCGRWFYPDQHNKKLCSEECKQEMQKIHWGESRYRRAKAAFEAKNPGKEYIPRKYNRQIDYGEFDEPRPERPKSNFNGKYKELLEQGKDYIEEQKKQTIEMFARIDLDKEKK